MARYLDDLEALLADPDGPVSINDAGELHLHPLAAEVVDPAVLVERDGVVARVPVVPLTEVLIKTDGEIHWPRHSRTPAAEARVTRRSSISATSTPRSSRRPATTAAPGWPS